MTPSPKQVVKERPTEVASGLAIAGAVIGLLVTNSVAAPVAAGAGVFFGFGPLVFSRFVDAWRKR